MQIVERLRNLIRDTADRWPLYFVAGNALAGVAVAILVIT